MVANENAMTCNAGFHFRRRASMTGDRRDPDLPPVVRRYLERALGNADRALSPVRLHQLGSLRTDAASRRWLRFRAVHQVDPSRRQFSWDARVRIAPLLHLRVRDGYANGIGSGRVQLLSMLTLASDSGGPELNTGALHRYLAEAVWYPAALLPSAGVAWRAADTDSAVATLADGGSTVSLEFRFDRDGDVATIYTPARWQRHGEGYRQCPWEGHFSDYRVHAGLRVPFKAEVGWHAAGALGIVWRGEIERIERAPVRAG